MSVWDFTKNGSFFVIMVLTIMPNFATERITKSLNT